MRPSLFITGATGFIGSYLLRRLQDRGYNRAYGLTRRLASAVKSPADANIQLIHGSIFDAHLYEPYLAASDVVVHLAACTGKARPQEYFHVNTDGTRFLLEQCHRLQVRNFLYVSSIAVKFADKSHYYYAQSKQAAEDLVRGSGLRYAIVRPTIVLGKEAPGWQMLARLAKAPMLVLPGDGQTKIQPIVVDDVVEGLLAVVDGGLFGNETFDLGGPEVVTIEDFLQRSRSFSGRKEAVTMHVNEKILLLFLSTLEKFFASVMPFNVGQLSFFFNDGVIESNKLYHMIHSRMLELNSTLRQLNTHA